MENKKSRKDWIKNFAIIFLSVLLVLTFFSNTIRNYSLPEVAAQYCYSGEITNKVRGQGTVIADDPYAVQYKESRKIESVKVKVGDVVEKGDTLFVLEEGDSEELKTAEGELKKLESEYEKALITGMVSPSVMSGAGSLNIYDAQAKIEALNKTIEARQNDIDTYSNLITIWESGSSESLPERKNLIDATLTYDNLVQQQGLNNTENTTKGPALAAAVKEAEDELAIVRAGLTVSENNVSGDEAAKLQAAKDKLAKAQKEQKEWDDFLANINNQAASAKVTVDKIQNEIDTKIDELKYNKSVAEIQKKEAEAELEKYVNDTTAKIDISAKQEAIDEKREEVNKLREEQGGTEITAPVKGTILSVDKVAGETIEKGDTVATIQVAGKGMTLQMTVSNEQAVLLTVGDEAEVTNSWWYTEVHARIKSIRPDTTNPSKSKIVTFELEGDVSVGQSLSLTVGRRTANYDHIVPNSAIKEDNDGKFVYRVNSKSTPLGTRYSVEKVAVKVLAQDETQSAISGALEDWEYIVTTSSKPLEDGSLIRLKD